MMYRNLDENCRSKLIVLPQFFTAEYVTGTRFCCEWGYWVFVFPRVAFSTLAAFYLIALAAFYLIVMVAAAVAGLPVPPIVAITGAIVIVSAFLVARSE